MPGLAAPRPDGPQHQVLHFLRNSARVSNVTSQRLKETPGGLGLFREARREGVMLWGTLCTSSCSFRSASIPFVPGTQQAQHTPIKRKVEFAGEPAGGTAWKGGAFRREERSMQPGAVRLFS